MAAVVWWCPVAAPIGRFIVRCRFDGAIWLCHMTLLSVVRCRLAVLFGSAFWLCHWVVSFGFAVCWTVALCHVIWQCGLAVSFGSTVWQRRWWCSAGWWHHGQCRLDGSLGGADWCCHWAVDGTLAVSFGCIFCLTFGGVLASEAPDIWLAWILS